MGRYALNYIYAKVFSSPSRFCGLTLRKSLLYRWQGIGPTFGLAGVAALSLVLLSRCTGEFAPTNMWFIPALVPF
jgi:hypothetical protein